MNADLIFDVGLHKGEDSEFYLKKGFKVVAVEANPKLCQQAGVRLRQYGDLGLATIVNAAIAEQAGPITFFVNEQFSIWGTTSKEWAARNESCGTRSSEITVEGIPFSELVERFGVPYYLKIDIEGADLLCLQALERFRSRPKYISIESTKVSWKGLMREFELLKSLGYSRFKIVDQSQVASQECPKPPKEGVFVEHRFVSGSSGLFGEEAPGSWLSEREALSIYRKIFLKYRWFGDAGILRRPHEFLKTIPGLDWLTRLMHVGWYDTHAAI
jgi:FkbM family methyltransferase